MWTTPLQYWLSRSVEERLHVRKLRSYAEDGLTIPVPAGALDLVPTWWSPWKCRRSS